MWKTAVIWSACAVLSVAAQTSASPSTSPLNHDLFDACTKGDLDRVKILIAQGADPEAREGSRQFTPLIIAAANQRWNIVRYFISTNVDMNSGATSGTRALIYALENDQDDLAIEMINAGADPDFCDPHYLLPIVYPARSGNVRLMQAFIDHHANVNLNGTDGPALYHAVGHDQLAIVKMLLEAGAEIDIAPYEGGMPDYRSMPLVGMAATHDDLDMIDLLLAHGADINAMGKDGCTPLIEALRASAPDTIRHLLDKGADVNKPGADGVTPLMTACDYGFNPIGVVQPLLDHGAKIEQTDSQGRTILAWCAMHDLQKPIYFLMSHGANVNAADSAGETPLTYAGDRGDGFLVGYFRLRGATRTDAHIIARPMPAPPLTKAQAWALAVGAMYAQYNGVNPHLLGGEQGADAEEARHEIRKNWGATDPVSFRKVLADLHDRGFGASYRGEASSLTSDDALKKVVAAAFLSEIQVERIQEGSVKWGNRLGLAWDLCRYIHLVGVGFNAGYIHADEAWADMLPAAREIQANFQSWREMSDNFLNGRIIWSDGLDQRFENCINLLLVSSDPNSVWNQLPWKTDLGH